MAIVPLNFSLLNNSC